MFLFKRNDNEEKITLEIRLEMTVPKYFLEATPKRIKNAIEYDLSKCWKGIITAKVKSIKGFYGKTEVTFK